MSMSKEQCVSSIRNEIGYLKEHYLATGKLIESLGLTLNHGDVSFATVEDVKRQLENVAARSLPGSLRALFRTLKARAVTRVKEI